MAILASGQVAVTKETIFLVKIASVFRSSRVIIKKVTFFNKGPGLETVTLSIKKKGGTSRIVRNFKLAQEANGEFPARGTFQLDDGDELEASASSADMINFVVLGEFTDGDQKR